MNDFSMDTDVRMICISSLEFYIEFIKDEIHESKPPKNTQIYRNLQLAQAAKHRLEIRDTKALFSELKITYAALEAQKVEINEALHMPDNSPEDLEQFREMRKLTNKAMRFLRELAKSYGRDIDEYKHHSSTENI